MHKARKRRKNLLINAAIVILLLLALSCGWFFFVLPSIENRQHEIGVLQQITAFKEYISAETEPSAAAPEAGTAATEATVPHRELLDAMQQYNRKIYLNGQADLADAWTYSADVFDLTEYGLEGAVVGLVTIPAIDVELPLYLGATYDNLASGFAQLSKTSMPIGGANTNCVIAGHRGWKGMAYMRDADLLEIGDSVYLKNLWETLEYRICDIKIILPHELSCCYIQEGRDLLTIVTCHPYGVGSHRIIITCERSN